MDLSRALMFVFLGYVLPAFVGGYLAYLGNMRDKKCIKK